MPQAIITIMKPRAYIETTIVSYLTAWPSRDVVVAGHQQVTRDWWSSCRNHFDVMASELVVQEASAGDQKAARDRLDVLDQLLLLEATEEALALARRLVDSGAIPPAADDDALHLAIAATNGIEYLVTWNCRHLANATRRAVIEAAIRDAGYEPPIICTPEELLEDDADEG